MMIKLYKQMVRVYDRMLRVTEAQRTAMGRLPEVDVVIRNVSHGAAKDITFEFSAPIESSDGTVVSEVAYFKDGLDFLAPNGQITCYRDNLRSLLLLLEHKGLTEGITVTTRSRDLADESYETEWTLNPFISLLDDREKSAIGDGRREEP